MATDEKRVAPLAGAWIETTRLRLNAASGASRPSRARGLKRAKLTRLGERMMSRPSRARGLKLREKVAQRVASGVAPLAGAWIETCGAASRVRRDVVAPLAGAWIETPVGGLSPSRQASRPSRARGLKHGVNVYVHGLCGSRPSRARGLKRTTDV